jgi:hypothetical protein
MKGQRATRKYSRTPVEWIAVGCVVLILGTLAAVVLRNPHDSTPEVDSEFPIGFVGVRPDAGDAIYDVHGNPLLDELYSLPDLKSWPTNKLHRGFIFDVKATNVGEVFPRFSYQFPNQSKSTLGIIAPSHVYRLPDGTMRVEVTADLRKPFCLRWVVRVPRRKPKEGHVFHETREMGDLDEM